jgi:hypothetical protein
MHNKRLAWFLIMIAVGLAGGLLYGWLINPVQYIDTSAESLHPGFKADYVLMVAEIYGQDGDLPGAIQRLSLLGPLPAQRLVADGLLTARNAGYTEPDLVLMEALSQALQAIPSSQPPVESTPADATPTTGGQP